MTILEKYKLTPYSITRLLAVRDDLREINADQKRMMSILGVAERIVLQAGSELSVLAAYAGEEINDASGEYAAIELILKADSTQRSVIFTFYRDSAQVTHYPALTEPEGIWLGFHEKQPYNVVGHVAWLLGEAGPTSG